MGFLLFLVVLSMVSNTISISLDVSCPLALTRLALLLEQELLILLWQMCLATCFTGVRDTQFSVSYVDLMLSHCHCGILYGFPVLFLLKF